MMVARCNFLYATEGQAGSDGDGVVSTGRKNMMELFGKSESKNRGH